MNPQELPARRIKELEADGYAVVQPVDVGPVRWHWFNTRSGASQTHSGVIEKQPLRSTKAQAWADADDFDRGNVDASFHKKDDWYPERLLNE